MTTPTTCLTHIIGLKVIAVSVFSDGLSIRFHEGTQLIVYNQCKLTGAERLPFEIDAAFLEKRVLSVDESKTVVAIIFEGALSLDVDMSDSGYRGPEAMQLTVPGMPIVIWS